MPISARSKKISLFLALTLIFTLSFFAFPQYKTWKKSTEQRNFLNFFAKPLPISWTDLSPQEVIFAELRSTQKFHKISNAIDEIVTSIVNSPVESEGVNTVENIHKSVLDLNFYWHTCNLSIKKLAFYEEKSGPSIIDLKMELDLLRKKAIEVKSQIDVPNMTSIIPIDVVLSGVDEYSILIDKLIALKLKNESNEIDLHPLGKKDSLKSLRNTYEKVAKFEPVLINKSKELFELSHKIDLSESERNVLNTLANYSLDWLSAVYGSVSEKDREQLFMISKKLDTINEIIGGKMFAASGNELPTKFTTDAIKSFSTVFSEQTAISELILENYIDFIEYQNTQKINSLLSQSSKKTNTIVWYGNTKAKQTEQHSQNREINKDEITDILDRFAFLNVVSSVDRQEERLQKIRENIYEVLGELKISKIVPNDDRNSISIQISTIDTKFNFWLDLTLDKNNDSTINITKKIESSKPIVVLRLENDSLFLDTLTLDVEQLNPISLNIKVPVLFNQNSGEEWQTSYIESEKTRQELALQNAKTQAIEQQNAEKIRQQALMQDPVYRYAFELTRHMSKQGTCLGISNMVLNIGASKLPDYVRKAQIDKIIDGRMGDLCIIN